MMRTHLSLMAALVLLVVVAGCSQPSAAPAQAPAAPKAAEPTKASAAPAAPTAIPAAPAAPTAAPAAKSDFPQKGKVITVIVPWTAGSGVDIAARMLAALMEKDLGTTIQVVNKVGAGSQVGITELTQAKPDGYTLAFVTIPGAQVTYLDPERKAIYNRKSIQPVALHNWGVGSIAVSADGPYKTAADVVNEGKANPDKFKMGLAGNMTFGHFMVLQLQQMSGAKFSLVQFDGGPSAMTAVIGGHVEAYAAAAGDHTPFVLSGKARVIGVADKQQSPYLPGVKTFEEQGYKIYGNISNGLIAPGGTPKDVVATISASLKKAASDAEQKKKLAETGKDLVYMDTPEFERFWDDTETTIKQLMPLAQVK